MNGTEAPDWQKQLKKSVTSLAGLPASARDHARRRVSEKYPIRIAPHYFSLIDQANYGHDPIAKQCLPDARELEHCRDHSEDPLDERRNMPYPFLIHRYRTRAVLLVTNRCAVHCRFCFRKRLWKKGNTSHDLRPTELATACRYLRAHPEIHEVLVSGGDPLMLANDRLEQILRQLSAIENLEVLRLGTRIPAVLPTRVDRDLAAMLARFPGLWVAVHFNHPREVTAQAVKACRTLLKKGLPLVNQTVLLAGVNDRAEILEELFRRLVKIGVKPLYLYHLDPVEGAAHFATGLEVGLALLREFRRRLSALATPVFAFDLPDGGGKVPLLPDYRRPGGFEAFDGRTIRYYRQELTDGQR